jgi:dephospho-CoA kinase
MTRIVGLSGGIGSGKSTVTRMLEELGATTVDADAIVHELQAPGSPLLDEIAEAFGPEVLRSDGALDREAVGAIVFRDPDARARLGKLMHPPVIAEMMRRAQAAVETSAPMVVLDIPLLFEGQKNGTGSAAVMKWEATILVWVPMEVQIERTMGRDDCDRGEAERRVAAQLPIDEKKAMATHVVDNSGTIEQTRAQVTDLYANLVSDAG